MAEAHTPTAEEMVDLIRARAVTRKEAVALIACALDVARSAGERDGLKQGFESSFRTIDAVLGKHIDLSPKQPE